MRDEGGGGRTIGRVAAFALGDGAAIPEEALTTAATLLLDTVGVAAGARALEAGRIARDLAAETMAPGPGAPAAPLWFDGRPASLPGAAFAMATQIDNLDAHDGYNPTKGHIGCAAVPALAAFAVARPELGGREALSALVVAYEVAARAGIALHATVADYHTSGAWNALGVAALGCRLMGEGPGGLREALGIAEYHGPRSQMLREIATPTMLHDGSGMGAWVGVTAALMAARGFAGAPAVTVEAPEAAAFWADLGADWTILRNYVKPYPVCRWAHAALDALAGMRAAHGLAADEIETVEIRTFAEAARLFPGMPRTTSEAQYSLAFAAAAVLRHGRVGAEHVCGPALSEPETAALVARIRVVEDPRHSAVFPARRRSGVSVTLADGRRLDSGDRDARGGPEAPLAPAEIRAKFDAMTATLGPERSAALWRAGEALVEDAPFARFADLLAAPAGDG